MNAFRRLLRVASLQDVLAPPVASLVAALLFWGFAHLGSEVVEGETRGFDLAILRAAETMRTAHPSIVGVMRDLSSLGSLTVLLLFTLAAVGYLWLVGAGRTAGMVAAAVLSGAVANLVLKFFFGRSRPPPELADQVLTSLSFPSGHASASAIVFLTLGALCATTRAARIERIYLVSVAAIFAALVGSSRVAL